MSSDNVIEIYYSSAGMNYKHPPCAGGSVSKKGANVKFALVLEFVSQGRKALASGSSTNSNEMQEV
jgi:hypothetical protein